MKFRIILTESPTADCSTIQRITISTITRPKNHDLCRAALLNLKVAALGLRTSVANLCHDEDGFMVLMVFMIFMVFMVLMVLMVLMVFMVFVVLTIFMVSMVSMMIVSPLSGHSCTQSPVGVRSRKPTIHTLISCGDFNVFICK